jgi:hypothetical protein
MSRRDRSRLIASGLDVDPEVLAMVAMESVPDHESGLVLPNEFQQVAIVFETARALDGCPVHATPFADGWLRLLDPEHPRLPRYG